MLQQLTSFTEQFAIIIPVIIGLVHVAKKTGLSSRYAPLLSIILGVVAGYFYVSPNTIGVLMGIVGGLSASGLWSGVKATVQ